VYGDAGVVISASRIVMNDTRAPHGVSWLERSTRCANCADFRNVALPFVAVNRTGSATSTPTGTPEQHGEVASVALERRMMAEAEAGGEADTGRNTGLRLRLLL
jgi:hypothetical protein